MPFTFTETSIQGVFVVTPKVFEDDRGFFMETYAKSAFETAGIKGELIQQNHSRSVRGVLRGLHFQRDPYAQARLVRCTRGEVFDVAVDIRKVSPTFGKWVSAILTESNRNMLYVPRGFAHGFLTMSHTAEVQYSVDNAYAPDYEQGIIWNDPQLNIAWPAANPILSKKDAVWPRLGQLNLG
jgi:dTDP-4-dehydrorhamnose 3,5-epimerase